jgi:hypothetical protein
LGSFSAGSRQIPAAVAVVAAEVVDRGDKRLAFGQFTLVGVSGDRGEHPFEQRHGVRAGKLAPLQPANQRTGAGEAGGAPLADASVFGVVDLEA